MKLGLLTACFPGLSLEEIATYASSLGLEALEVAAWPGSGGRPFTATHVDVVGLTQTAADGVGEMLASKHLAISGLAYYDNNLHPDPAEREAVHRHVEVCIDAAAMLGCPVVGTFIGRDPTKTVAENLKEAERAFSPLVQRAGEQGVRLVIENCVMEGWHPDGYPGQPRVLARALGVDVLPGGLPQL